jgi:hypothetical protein
LTDALSPGQLDSYFDAIEAECQGHGIDIVRLASQVEGCVRVQLQGSSRRWDLSVKGTATSLSLPLVWLNDPTQLLAHVGYGGVVCIDDKQGLSVDSTRRAHIAAYAVREAYVLLEKSAADAAGAMTEFYNELEGYWLGLPSSRRARGTFEVDGQDRVVSAHLDEKSKPQRWFVTEKSEALPRAFRASNTSAIRALYLHMDRIPLPPANPGRLGSEFIDAVKSALTPAQQALWSEFIGISRNKSKRLALLVSMPRAAGGVSLVGLVFYAHRGVVDATGEVVPITVRRHTATYMRERGGATIESMGKHIAILGCGAVGSFVADTLACSGVGKLTLVDHDDYSEDNVFRHVLSPMYIDSRKTVGLKVQLEDRYPGLEVNCVTSTAQEWDDGASLSEFDGIVVAFGAPSVERSYSRRFRLESSNLPVVFTWLEPLDLGGHSVLMWSGQEGCLDCLYRDDEGQPTLSPRNAFLEPNQPISKNLTGCASTFVPFGAIQARRTGLLAAEHMLDALAGEDKASYRFWVGAGKVAAEEGLRTTNWWRVARKTPADESTALVFGRPCARCRAEK